MVKHYRDLTAQEKVWHNIKYEAGSGWHTEADGKTMYYVWGDGSVTIYDLPVPHDESSAVLRYDDRTTK